ncbi:MAG: cellulase family glycosylhydrolase [bacterium]
MISTPKIVRAHWLWVIVGAVLAALIISQVFPYIFEPRNPKLELGVTFSTKYSKDLGLDFKETYQAIINDLSAKRVRLPVYWSEVEPSAGQYDFNDYDWLVSKSAEANVSLILAIGQRLPRYPECHLPGWARVETTAAREEALLEYLRQVVKRYDQNQAVAAWQIENEPLFPFFGECDAPDYNFLKREVTLVKSLSAKPIIVTSSGEFGSWVREARLADVLGISLYRGAHFEQEAYWAYQTEPWLYRLRAWFARPYVQKIFISELQVEPWASRPITQISLEQQNLMMTPKLASENLAFAKQTGFPEIYLWGVEWWYYLKTKMGQDDMWIWGERNFRQL